MSFITHLSLSFYINFSIEKIMSFHFKTNKAKHVGQDSLGNDQLVNKETNIAESITEE